jgi:hypothetical protein
MGKYNAKPGGTLTGAQVDRLCVLPGARGRGVKERLLRCADGFHSVGLPVRVKTASRTAAESFVRCPLLAYDGFKDPTKAGVSKRRGTKTVVVVDGEDGGKIKNAGEDRYDPRRYEDDWRERSPSVPRSIPTSDDNNTRHPTAETRSRERHESRAEPRRARYRRRVRRQNSRRAARLGFIGRIIRHDLA